MKRFLYILGVFAFSVLLVCTMVICALQSERVEHAVLRLATRELSRGLGAEAEIGDIGYRFPARIQINHLYLSDQQGDTLAYIEKVYAHFRLLPLLKNEIRFSRVELSGGVTHLYPVDSTQWNYAFLADVFRSETPRERFRSFLSVRDIRIDSIRAQVGDYQAELHHASLDLYHFTADSLDASIHHLRGKLWQPAQQGDAATPFLVEDLQLHFLYNDTTIALPALMIRLPNSHLTAKGEYNSYLRLDVTDASLCPRDIAMFVPALGNMDKLLQLRTHIEGNTDSLSVSGLTLAYDSREVFRGNAQCRMSSGNWRDAYLRIQCEDLTTNAAQLQDFVADLTNRPFHLPSEVHRLGNMHYRGLIDGNIHDLTLHGAFRTALGVITTDAALQSDSAFQQLAYNARVATNKFRLGKMLAHQPLGPVSLDIRMKGNLTNGINKGKISGKIRDVTYNDYTYQAIVIDGQFKPQHFDGMLSIDDDNLQLQFAGLVNLTQHEPDVNFDLRIARFRPEILRLSDKLNDTELGFSLAANLSGLNPDKMNGYLVVDSIRMRNGLDSTLIRQMKLIVEASENDHKNIKLTSDFVTASLSGQFQYAELPQALLRFVHQYVPNAFPRAVTQKMQHHLADRQASLENATPSAQSIDFYLYGHRLRSLQRVLRLPVTLGDQPVLKGFYHEADNLFGLQAYASSVNINGSPIQDITLALNNFEGPIAMSLSAKALQMNSLVHIAAQDNTINMDLSIHQLDSMSHVYAGDLHLHTHFSQYAGLPLIDLHILPSTIVLKDSTYTINESRINYCVADTVLNIDSFQVEASHQYIRAQGTASRRAEDSLHIALGNIDAGFVLPFVLPEEKFKLGGYLTGWATLYSLFSRPTFEADVRLDSTQMNDMLLGTTLAQVALDKTTNDILINGDVYSLQQRKVAHVDGQVITSTGHWGITVYPDSIPLSFINHWTSGIISDISGYGSGVVDIFGEDQNTWVTAKVKAEDGALTIPFTGCRYYLSDSVTMDSTSIQFRNITLYDSEKHPLHLDGALYHDCFLNFRYGFDVQVDNAMALNLPDKAGEMLQGLVYANGDVHIVGDENEVNIQANARTVGKSRFRFSIDYASTAAESNFITFTDHNQVSLYAPVDAEDEQEPELFPTLPSSTRVLLAMNIDIDQHLLVQLMLGERNGDMLQGRGDGSLRFTYDSQNEDIKLMGNYELQQGTLDFTVGNIIRRQFTITEGSTVSWSGSPEQPQLNVNAKYRVTASLKDLFGSEIDQLATTRTSVPVNTCLNMSGTLENPVLQFAIELPNSDENIQSQVRAIINTDEMLMRQVVYLLVFGKFFMPEYMTSTQYIGLNESYSLLSSTITGQINAWLGKLTNVFSMGVNIRTDGEGADASQEYEAQFQLQPVDRLLINGNVGYRYNDIANQPFFGDLDVEVLLTDDGKLRLKGYTHTVDKYSLRQASTIQGIGFVWKHDFNPLTKEERAQRKEARKAKKGEAKAQ
ncbi:MAG: translocation/assembly module TamB domain-containing protein [Paludibacteraceae bacterium]